jgi:hypothetical protein
MQIPMDAAEQRRRVKEAYKAYPWLKAHEYASGPWCFILKNVKRLRKPIPAKGALGFWNCSIAPRGPAKALTIKQPWAELIALEMKRVENRSWRTNFRGRIAVHTGINKSVCRQMKFEPDLMDRLDFGAIIATVDIVDCVYIGERVAPKATLSKR